MEKLFLLFHNTDFKNGGVRRTTVKDSKINSKFGGNLSQQSGSEYGYGSDGEASSDDDMEDMEDDFKKILGIFKNKN